MEGLRSQLALVQSQYAQLEKLLLLRDKELERARMGYSQEIFALHQRIWKFKQFGDNPDQLNEKVRSLEHKLEESRAQVKGLSLELLRERDRNRVGASILKGLADSLVSNAPVEETGVYKWSMKETTGGKWLLRKLNVEAESKSGPGQPPSIVGLPTPRPSSSVHSGATDNLITVKTDPEATELPLPSGVSGQAVNPSSPVSPIIDVDGISEASMDMNGLRDRISDNGPPAAPPGPTRVSDDVRSFSLDSRSEDFRVSTPMRFTTTTPLVDKWVASLPTSKTGKGRQPAKPRGNMLAPYQTPPAPAIHGIFDRIQHICECGKRFEKNAALKRHLKYYALKLHKSVFGCEPNRPIYDMVCDICRKTFPNKGLLQSHKNRYHR